MTERVSGEDVYVQDTSEDVVIESAQDVIIEGNAVGGSLTIQHAQDVVVNADGRGINRVRLPFEDIESYDTDWYEDAAIRAVESIVSCVGWDRTDIEQYLTDTIEMTLASYRTHS
mgnify:CR=1 FL=1